jgi:hypothetical protein
MSYAIAPTFEGNRMGIRRLSALSGIGGVPQGLGDVRTVANNLVSMGWDASLINGLIQAGATEQQLYDLQDGITDPTTLLMQLKAIRDPGMSPISPTTQPAAPLAAPQVPSGSTLTYSATWSFALNNVSNSSAIASLQSALPAYGMSVLSGSAQGGGILGYGIQVTIKDNIGHALLSDAKSVLDSLLRGLVGTNVTGSNLTIMSVPNQPLPPGSFTPPTDLGAWFQANWGYLAAALGAIVILPPLIKKL